MNNYYSGTKVAFCFILKLKITLFYLLSFVFICYTTHCHLLSLIVICFQSLSFLYDSLSVIVILCHFLKHLLYHSLSLDGPFFSIFINSHWKIDLSTAKDISVWKLQITENHRKSDVPENSKVVYDIIQNAGLSKSASF